VKAGRWNFRQIFFRGQRRSGHAGEPDPAEPLYSGWAFIQAPAVDGERQAEYDRTGRRSARATNGRNPRQAESRLPLVLLVNDMLPLHEAMSRTGRSPWRSRPFRFHDDPAGESFCVENVLEELDRPGEWCLRTDTGMLCFWPPSRCGRAT